MRRAYSQHEPTVKRSKTDSAKQSSSNVLGAIQIVKKAQKELKRKPLKTRHIVPVVVKEIPVELPALESTSFESRSSIESTSLIRKSTSSRSSLSRLSSSSSNSTQRSSILWALKGCQPLKMYVEPILRPIFAPIPMSMWQMEVYDADPLMVSEYVLDIYHFMKQIEVIEWVFIVV